MVDPADTFSRADHWDGRYLTTGSANVSWYTPDMSVSFELLRLAGTSSTSSVVDVGGGTSVLVDRLVAEGTSDVTVVDVSAVALDEARHRLAARVPHNRVAWVHADVLEWTPTRTWDVWHDRAVFHFLTQPGDIDRYVEQAARSVVSGGHLVVGTFSEDGPPTCSGLPVARYSTAALAEVFVDQFELVHAAKEDHLTPSGIFQHFSWVVLQRRADSDTPTPSVSAGTSPCG